MAAGVTITRVEVRQFQSIAHADLDLGPWVSFIGGTDIGKSAIVRALHAALTNRRGDSFIRRGAKSCEVTLHLDGGAVLTWAKARGASGTYTLDGTAYEKTSGVPDAISDALRVSIEIAGEDFTPGIQRQHDSPFLLAETPRRRAQILGALDGSNITMVAETILRRAQRLAQDDVKAAEREVERLDEAIVPYSALPAAEDAYAVAAALSDALGARSARLTDVTALSAALVGAAAGGAREARLVQAWALPADLPPMDGLEARVNAVAGAQAIGARLVLIAVQCAAARRVLAAMPDTSGLDALDERCARLRGAEAIGVTVAALYGDRVTHEQAIEHWRAQEHVEHEALAAMAGQACPECGKVLDRMEVRG